MHIIYPSAQHVLQTGSSQEGHPNFDCLHLALLVSLDRPSSFFSNYHYLYKLGMPTPRAPVSLASPPTACYHIIFTTSCCLASNYPLICLILPTPGTHLDQAMDAIRTEIKYRIMSNNYYFLLIRRSSSSFSSYNL